MLKRPAVLAVCAALATALATFIIILAPTAQAATPVRIMPLGDSITGSPGCWRALLWQRLQQTGYTNIDMVGTLGPQGCSVPYDGENEGHGGALVTTVADQGQLVGWLAATRPDVVLMHFGTNDVWSNRTTAQILTAYSKLVDQMRASNATMKILVAKIIPVAPPTCTECPQRTIDLNNAIPGWASANTTPQSPITVVDQWTGWVPGTDTGDGVHPNDSGTAKMADKWYAPLAAAIGGSTPTSASPTTRVPTTGDTTAPTVPTGLTGQTDCNRVTSLSWTASTDNVAVTGYDVYRISGNTLVLAGTTTATRFSEPATSGSYQVRARDAAGNLSGFTAAFTPYVAACPPPTSRPPTSTPPTSTPPTSTPPTTSMSGCTAAYQLAGSWPGGFQGQVTVANTGANPTNGWTVTLAFPDGQKITQLWGARTSSTGSPYVVTNESYNGVLGPNGNTTFGFLGSFTGANSAPVATCTRTP